MRRVIFVCFMFAIVMEGFSAQYNVVNTNDGGLGSFRDALNFANANPGRDTILFSIPGIGPFILQPLLPYPILVDQGGVFIDGLSQAGAFSGSSPPATANLQIVLDGFFCGPPCNGLEIQSQGNTIRGLVIMRFAYDGISILANHPPTAGNQIYCNFIGTDVTGAQPRPNGTLSANAYAGIYIRPSAQCSGFAHNNFIDGNLVSGNNGDGVAISSCPPADVYMNHVTHNFIGTDISGIKPLGNLHAGVYLGEGTHDNVVGDNVICDNQYEGVSIIGYYQQGGPAWFTHTNHIHNNLIGMAADGVTQLGNVLDGVAIGVWGPIWKLGYANLNNILHNTIAFNGKNGILVWENPANNANGDFNWLSQNSIFANALLGIDLDGDGVTPNDPSDPDAMANEDLNYPVITSAVRAQGVTTITGTLDIGSIPLMADIELFLSQPSISFPGHGQGKIYLGTVNPNAAGAWSANLSGLAIGDLVCATTTDPLRNTSEFSANAIVTQSTQTVSVTQTESWLLSPTTPNPVDDFASWVMNLQRSCFVSLRIINPNGHLVSNLFDGWLTPGQYTFIWDGLDNRGTPPAPGFYLMQAQSEKNVAVRTLLKM